MKTAMIIWNLGFVISISTTFGLASKNRHKPRLDEIERVINETHSVIWKCKENSECNPGLGLNVHCGTSIPFSMPIKCVPCVKGANFSETKDHSTCKSCKNCGKYEDKSGECTPEEDTTACLGTCHKGFYMDKITGGCHPCSDCCEQYEKYHEKQCENSGLPSKRQCRQNNLNCHQPTKENPTTPNHDKPGLSLSHSDIAGIVVGIISILVIVVAVILIACYGWQKIKSTLKNCCCCCCHLVISNSENSHTIVFDGSESRLQGESQLATGKSGHHFPATPEGTSKSLKKPVYRRMQSVPVESKQEPINRKKYTRSHSHPGALNKSQETSKVNCSPLRLFRSPRTKRKKGYIPVPTFEPSDVDNIPESPLKPVHVVVQQPDMLNPLPAAAQPVRDNEDIPQTSSQSVDVGVRQQSKLETEPVPDIEVSLENSSQSFDVVVRHQGKLEGLEKLSMSTSTTGLFDQPGTFLQFADIPQEFLSNYLSQKISAIPIQFYCEICKKLDILRRINWDDYRQLGEIVGLDKDDLLWLGQRENPTQEILQQFNSKKGSSVGKFKIIVERMGRDDVVAIIENWILFEWHKNINSSSVRPQLQTFV